jgi:hypothetical protein
MTPKEVGGLQALAMAHGGSLTINPQTGLPEAGFLSSLLPMLAGGALTVLSGGALTPLMAAGLVGGGTALATGSLQKGLMAGLGAYGGAGLGAGLSSMGQAAAAKTAGTAAGTTAGTTAGTGTTLFPSGANAAGTQASTFGNIAKGSGQFPSFVPSDLGPAALQTSVPTVPLNPNALAFNPNYVAPTAGAGAPISTLGSIGQGITPAPSVSSTLGAGFKQATGSVQGLKDLYAASEAAAPYSGVAALGSTAMGLMGDQKGIDAKKQVAMIRPYEFSREVRPGVFDMGAPIYSAAPGSSAEKNYFDDRYTALTPYRAPGPEYAAEGGLMGMAVGGPVETMAAENAVGGNMMYPQANLQTALYSNPMVQRPEAVNVISPGEGPAVGAYTGEVKFAGGGLSDLGGYSDGGRLLKGPGDGVSDSIPAVIGNRQPARLADGEFVVPARIVSELGNGSTEAGARKLYAMMDRVQKARRKTVGKNKVAANTRSEKYLPA